jgi:hypothetical protein
MQAGVLTLMIDNSIIGQAKVDPAHGEMPGESGGATAKVPYIDACDPHPPDLTTFPITRVAGRLP